MTLARWAVLALWLPITALIALIALAPGAGFHTGPALGLDSGSLLLLLLCGALCSSAITWHHQHERSAHWLTLALLGFAVIFAAPRSGIVPWLPPSLAPQRLLLAAACWPPAALLLYFQCRLRLAMPRRFPLLLTGSAALLGLLALRWPMAQLPMMVSGWWALLLGLALLLLSCATRRRRQGARWCLLSLLPLLPALAADAANHGVAGLLLEARVTQLWTPFAIVLFVLAQFWLYIGGLSRANRLVSRHSSTLQDAVERRTRELRTKNEKLQQAQQALQQANDALQLLSITDSLTQVYNRLHFEQQLTREWRRCARQQSPLSVLMIDADNFKRINDSAGHLAGDHCLQALAAVLRRQFRRAGELLARYGGEEFVVLLPDTNQTQALALAEAVRIAVEELVVEHSGDTLRLTVSIGVSTALPPTVEQAPELLLAAADSALYAAKAAGRNRIHSCSLNPRRRASTRFGAR